jgi:hypothetical protein
MPCNVLNMLTRVYDLRHHIISVLQIGRDRVVSQFKKAYQ